MIRSVMLLLALGLLAARMAAAQDTTPTPVGPVFVPSPTFTSVPTPVITPTPPGDDPRIAVCSAPFQPGWVPYVVKRNDRLADLLVGVEGLPVEQVAALNCLDDSAALPVGAVIWLPVGTANLLAHPAPQDTSPGVDRAEILSFSASADTVQNEGAGVTFTWRASGTEAYFYICPPRPEHTCERPIASQPVPLEYTTPPVSGFRYAGPARYRLDVQDGESRVTKDVLLEVVCTHERIGEVAGFQACPIEPIRYVFTAWQPFERGDMMWISESGQIWVMTDDQRLRIFEDRYQEGDPTPAAAPPPDRFTPQRGFGRVWEALGGPDSPLGWALGEETGYDAGWQPAGRNSYTTYVGGPFGILYAITLIPGTDTGYWVQIR